MSLRQRIQIVRPPSTGGGGTTVIQAGDTDGTSNLGTGNFSLSHVSGNFPGIQMGDSAFNMPNVFSGSGIFPEGSGDFFFTGISGIGIQTGVLGSGDFAMSGLMSGGMSTGLWGTGDYVMISSSTGRASGYARKVANSGTAWSNTGFATGSANDEAFISGAATAIATAAFDGMMILSGFQISPDVPPGWTRNKVEAIIRHRWDTTVGLLSSASYNVILMNSGGAFLQTLENRGTNDSSDSDGTIPILTGYDITAATTGLSNQHFSGLRIGFRATCNILVLGGNASSFVSYAFLVQHYNRTGIT